MTAVLRRPLSPGTRFSIKSRRGSRYQLTCVSDPTGAPWSFFRQENGEIARFFSTRLDWSSLRIQDREGLPLLPGDQALITLGEAELRGRVAQAHAEGFKLRLERGSELDLPWGVSGSLLFAASDWQPGDAFLIQSRSGRVYSGETLEVGAERVTARLGDGAPVTLRRARLDLRSLRVLLPLPAKRLA